MPQLSATRTDSSTPVRVAPHYLYANALRCIADTKAHRPCKLAKRQRALLAEDHCIGPACSPAVRLPCFCIWLCAAILTRYGAGGGDGSHSCIRSGGWTGRRGPLQPKATRLPTARWHSTRSSDWPPAALRCGLSEQHKLWPERDVWERLGAAAGQLHMRARGESI